MDSASFRYDPNFPVIAITGGPCAGKSTLMAHARQWLEDHGFKVVIMPEVATELISAGFSPFDDWLDPLAFQEHLVLYSLERENRYYEMAKALHSEKPMVFLCDRGLLDSIAYIGRNAYLRVLERHGYDLHELRERYSAIIHMVTAANGAEKYYTLANNTARSETPEQAKALDKRTQEAWFGHQHLFVVDNSTGFEQKIQRALSALVRVLSMPEPLETERKFLVLNFTLDMLPQEAVSIDIEQNYLVGSDKGERRLRKRTLDGTSSYYLTEKTQTSHRATRIERERQISRREYEMLLAEHDPATTIIRKKRYSFVCNGRHIELDVYSNPCQGLVILEVELQDIAENVSLPQGWLVQEVTDDSKYKNRSIAEGSLDGQK